MNSCAVSPTTHRAFEERRYLVSIANLVLLRDAESESVPVVVGELHTGTH